MKQLFGWLKETAAQPLMTGAVFHYEFEFIHPFADGNGRAGRLWQTLILSRWNPVFGDIAVESMIHAHPQDYYNAINQSNAQNSSTPFVEFILKVILETLTTDQAGDQVTDQVKRLVHVLAVKPLSAAEMMKKLNLKHRPTFRANYLNPALVDRLIEMTAPDSPNSPTQKYLLTEKGKQLRKKIGYRRG